MLCLGSSERESEVEALNIVIFGNLTLNYCKSLFFSLSFISMPRDRTVVEKKREKLAWAFLCLFLVYLMAILFIEA